MKASPARSRLGRLALIAIVAVAAPRWAAAQEAPVIPGDVLTAAWQRASAPSAAALAAAKAPADRQPIYEAIITRMMVDPQIARLRDSAHYQVALAKLAAEVPDATLAKTVNGALGNPASGQVVERSGLSDLIALSGDFKELLASHHSAISLNLNALALFGSGTDGAYSAPYRYRQHEALKRFGGTVTFGAKMPEGEITGFTGLPNANRLLDVLTWDVKVRVAGDRDPRASRWYPLLLGEMGDDTEIAARLSNMPFIPFADSGIVAKAASKVLGSHLAEAKRAIARSLQASVKVAGQHLTKESGKNKLTVAGMLDAGLGSADLTLNLAYSAMDGAQPDATDPFSVREVQLGGGLTGSLLRDVIAAGRSAEWSLSFTGKLPIDDGAVPVERKRVWKAGLSLVLPFQKGAKVPISVTYSNDPNNLAKDKYVTGHIGISYDFGALLRPLGGSQPGAQ